MLTDPQLSPPLLLQVPRGEGEGSDGTIPWEPRETSRTVGFVMTSERSCPRAGGDGHIFDNRYDQSRVDAGPKARIWPGRARGPFSDTARSHLRPLTGAHLPGGAWIPSPWAG